MDKISAVIITVNEEGRIGRCLDSLVGSVDEIVVIDGHSTDRTGDICRERGARVVQAEWRGYGETKNLGNELASHEFILSIDSDEALSPELGRSISGIKGEPGSLYEFNRLTNYCGHWVRHCGWYPDRKLRLFDRRVARWEGDVHEKLVHEPALPVRYLRGDLLHYSFDSLSDHLRRVDRYSELAAAEFLQRGKTGAFSRLLFGPPLKFLKSYLLQRGFLDGFAGFCVCSISAFDLFLRYVKVIELQRHGSRGASE
jgi:glycosyltransferase involved in cell wall biosynthesis